MEVYGEKPKIFSKDWYGYFWMYHKTHVFFVIFLLILIVPFIYQHLTTPEYDLSVMIAGNRVVSDEVSDAIKGEIEALISDTNGDGEKNVDIQKMTFGDSSDPEYLLAQNTKVMAEISAGDAFLYLFSYDKANDFLNGEDAELMFVPTVEYAPEIPKERLMLSKGVPYAVKIEEGDLKGYCIMVRNLRADEVATEKQQNAKITAGYLAKR